ncbi:MAG: hypothetical protein K0S65_4051, partial [Labilithrix sp.]|nr:hypothetical protein [Labilithrix sp.]
TNRLLRAVNSLSNAAIADTSAVNYGGSVHLAQTLIREVGLQTSFVIGQRLATDNRFDSQLQRRTTTDTTDTTIRFAAAASFDSYHLGVPISVLGEYAVEKTYRDVEGTAVYVPSAHLLGAGIFYSGRTDLQLGVSLFGRRNLVAQEATALDGTRARTGIPTSIFGQFVIRYVWN